MLFEEMLQIRLLLIEHFHKLWNCLFKLAIPSLQCSINGIKKHINFNKNCNKATPSLRNHHWLHKGTRKIGRPKIVEGVSRQGSERSRKDVPGNEGTRKEPFTMDKIGGRSMLPRGGELKWWTWLGGEIVLKNNFLLIFSLKIWMSLNCEEFLAFDLKFVRRYISAELKI